MAPAVTLSSSLSLCPWEGARHKSHLTDEETEVQHPVQEQSAQSTRTRTPLGDCDIGLLMAA